MKRAAALALCACLCYGGYRAGRAQAPSPQAPVDPAQTLAHIAYTLDLIAAKLVGPGPAPAPQPAPQPAPSPPGDDVSALRADLDALARRVAALERGPSPGPAPAPAPAPVPPAPVPVGALVGFYLYDPTAMTPAVDAVVADNALVDALAKDLKVKLFKLQYGSPALDAYRLGPPFTDGKTPSLVVCDSRGSLFAPDGRALEPTRGDKAPPAPATSADVVAAFQRLKKAAR